MTIEQKYARTRPFPDFTWVGLRRRQRQMWHTIWGTAR